MTAHDVYFLYRHGQFDLKTDQFRACVFLIAQMAKHVSRPRSGPREGFPLIVTTCSVFERVCSCLIYFFILPIHRRAC